MHSNKNSIDLSIIIPALDEEKRIGDTLSDLADYLKKDKLIAQLSVEIIVVSADSKDKTHDVVLSKKHLFEHFKFLTPGKRVGKGRDVKVGMLAATGNAVLFMDADEATPLFHIAEFYNLYLEGNEVVIGTRNLIAHHPNIIRRIISITGNIIFRIVGGLWVPDSQCGFKLFSYRAAQLCFNNLSIMGWGFDMEVLTIAQSNKIPLKCVQLIDWRDIPGGTFENKLIRNIISSLNDLRKIFINRVFSNYKFK